MPNILKNLSIETKLSFSEDSFNDPRYIKTRVKLMHNGKNPNNSNFEDEAIDFAKSTLQNIFILANVVETEDGVLDFGAHDFHIESNKMDDGDTPYKMIYDELPIGIIPETNNYEYVYDEEMDRNYVWVDALIVRGYSNYAEDIIKRYIEEEKDIKISMEISVQDYNYDDEKNVFDILKYTYEAVTFLGQKYNTGMKNAKATFTDDEVTEQRGKFMERINELKQLFSNEPQTNNEEVDMDFEKLKQEHEVYRLNVQQKWEKIENALPDEDYSDDDGNWIGSTWFYLTTFDDVYAFAIKNTYLVDGEYSKENIRVKYNVSDSDELSIEKDSMEVVVYEPITLAEKEKLDQDRNGEYMALQAEFDAYKSESEIEKSELEEKYNDSVKDIEVKTEEFNKIIEAKELEIARLSEFKDLTEKAIHEAEIDEIIADFDSKLNEVEEYKQLKENAYEMSTEDLENTCFGLVGRLNHKKKVYSKNKTVPTVVFAKQTETDENDDEKQDEYVKRYGEMAKYLKNKQEEF